MQTALTPPAPSRDLAALKRKVDLVALARSRGVELTRQGNDYVGRCPFHSEKEPSFHVTPSKNLFHCFGCGAAGSVIDFVMRLEGLSLNQAVDRLLTQEGLVQRAVDLVPEPAAPVPSERAQKLLERVVTIYRKNFEEGPEGKAYLAKRGLSDQSLLDHHQVGFANGRLPELLPRGDRELLGQLQRLGVLLKNGRERFARCVVFPVRDDQGHLVTLYGRFTGPGDKRHLYLPGRPTGLWNAAALKSYGELILVESVIDGLSVATAGHPNVVAVQGTNGLKAPEVEQFQSHGVRRLRLFFDGDDSGRQALHRVRPLLEAFELETCSLPENQDPNSYLVAHGPEALAQRLAHPQDKPPDAPAVEALPDGLALTLGVRCYQIRGLEKGARKLKATVRVEGAGKLHVDTLDFYSARWRRQLVGDLARTFEETAETLEAEIIKLMRLCEGHQPEPAAATARPVMSEAARREALAFAQRPDLIDQILADFDRCGLVGERANKLLCYLAAVSRKMDKPLSVLILSSSGAGKTTLQDKTLQFCPPEEVVKLTSLSGKALFYKERMSLKHKVLALEEGEGMSEASYAIRNLVSAGELVIEATIKDLVTGKLTTMENRVEGPTAVFLTTTDPDTDPETKSRFFVTSVDESREQTRAILADQRRRQTRAGLADQASLKPILEKHRNFQRLLKPVAVVNPYADQLSFGDDRLQSRRDQPKYLNLIKAVAYLRQEAKPPPIPASPGQAEPAPIGASPRKGDDACPCIEVDKEDIRLANDLANQILGHSLDELSRPGYELLLLLEKQAAFPPAKPDGVQAQLGRQQTFTRRQIREFTGWSQSRVHRYLKELIDLEYVLVESGRNGTLQTYRLCYRGEGKDGQKFMLGLKPIEELTDPPA